jgi:hypothetical protein
VESDSAGPGQLFLVLALLQSDREMQRPIRPLITASDHALEHIPDPRVALKEMRRVLSRGGGYWIGAPNRHRGFSAMSGAQKRRYATRSRGT